MKFVGREPGHDNHYIYGGNNAKMNILYAPETGMSGIATLSDKRTFLLENCHKKGYLWIEVDSNKAKETKK